MRLLPVLHRRAERLGEVDNVMKEERPYRDTGQDDECDK